MRLSPVRARLDGAPAEDSDRSTRKDAPPPSRSSTHARPPCSSANARTSDRPIPRPGAAAWSAPPRLNASKIRSRAASGTPGPASSTAMRTPSLSGRTRTQMGESGGAYLAAFDTRFSTMRSSFDCVEVHHAGVRVDLHVALLGGLALGHDAADHLGDVDALAARLEDAEHQTVEIEEVVEQVVHGPGGVAEPSEQRALLLRGQLRALALQVAGQEQRRCPRIAPRGVRSSCDTPCRKVFLMRSSARSSRSLRAQRVLGAAAANEGAELGGHAADELHAAAVLRPGLLQEELQDGHALVAGHDGDGERRLQAGPPRRRAVARSSTRSARPRSTGAASWPTPSREVRPRGRA